MVTITVAEIVDCESGVALGLSVSYPTVLVHKVWEGEAKATPIRLGTIKYHSLDYLLQEQRTLVALTPWRSI
jgi:hypothetical protein